MQERKGCLQNRLYILRKADGSQNSWAISTIREAERTVSSEPGFIGLALRGSAGKGYAGPYSDVDLLVIFDLDSTTEPERVLEFYRSVRSRIERPIVDVRFWKAGLADEICRDSGNLFRLVTGTRINEYRTALVDRIKASPLGEREAKVSSMADFLAEDDVKGHNVLRARIPSNPSIEEIEASRKTLWTRRIAGFLAA